MIEPTINDGPMPTSRMPGCSRFTWPGNQRDSLDEETTDWRAVCEKTARTVRRAGSVQADPDPYHTPQQGDVAGSAITETLVVMGPRLRGDDRNDYPNLTKGSQHRSASGGQMGVLPRLRRKG